MAQQASGLQVLGVAGLRSCTGGACSGDLLRVQEAMLRAYAQAGFDGVVVDAAGAAPLQTQRPQHCDEIPVVVAPAGALAGEHAGPEERPGTLALPPTNALLCHERRRATPARQGWVSRPDAALTLPRTTEEIVFSGGRLLEIGRVISTIRTRGAHWQRLPQFAAVVRPVVAETEEAAWARAFCAYRRGHPTLAPATDQGRRLLALAAEHGHLDAATFARVARGSNLAGAPATMIGAPELIALRLLAYLDSGVSTLIIHGFEPLTDAGLFGSLVLPLLRAELQRRDLPVSLSRQPPAGNPALH